MIFYSRLSLLTVRRQEYHCVLDDQDLHQVQATKNTSRLENIAPHAIHSQELPLPSYQGYPRGAKSSHNYPVQMETCCHC